MSALVLFFDPVQQQDLAQERLVYYVAVIEAAFRRRKQMVAFGMRSRSLAQSRFRSDVGGAIRQFWADCQLIISYDIVCQYDLNIRERRVHLALENGGETSGETGGETSGETSGETGGETSGETSGETGTTCALDDVHRGQPHNAVTQGWIELYGVGAPDRRSPAEIAERRKQLMMRLKAKASQPVPQPRAPVKDFEAKFRELKIRIEARRVRREAVAYVQKLRDAGTRGGKIRPKTPTKIELARRAQEAKEAQEAQDLRVKRGEHLMALRAAGEKTVQTKRYLFA
ncbi:hypothetical protein K438DRAFT_1960379 [Mycena galopus ATCC 62051]|nr:hypothetical protein K438DRAFT_1960379 [Mycena galopus ATCC 62051]